MAFKNCLVALAAVAAVSAAPQGGYDSAASTTAAPSYACNPAHQYPEGQSCISSAGTLMLVAATSSAAPSYACNPAHQYPAGQSCISKDGTLTLATATSAPAPSSTTGSGDCYAEYNACRVAPDSNKSYCASQYASCLGYNPFANNGTNTVTENGSQWVTAVVTAYTTVCPSPTSPTVITVQSSTYTITKETTITVANCPGGCTITTKATTKAPIASASTGVPPASQQPVVTSSAKPVASVTASSTRAVYTGGAERIGGSAALMLGAIGLLAL